MNKYLPLWIVLSCGAVTELSYIIFSLLSTEYGNAALYMVIYFETFCLFFAAWFFVRKAGDSRIAFLIPFTKKLFDADEAYTNKLSLPVLIILFGILFRITLIPSAPATSPDVYRYMFEGRTALSGYNPYTVPAADERLKSIRDEHYEKVIFKNIPAMYPPFAEMLFAAAQAVTPGSYVSLKIIYLLFEILTLFILLKLLILKGKDPLLVILYAWLPLPVMEYFVNAHIDAAGLSMLLLFVYLVEKENYKTAALPLALSVLTKLYPLMLFPLLLKKLKFSQFIIFGFITACIIILFYLPFVYNNLYVIEGLMKYVKHWEFNASVYNIIKLISNGFIARQVCSILLIASIIIISIKYLDFTKAVFGVFTAFMIFATTLYPWYIGWTAVFNPVAGFASVMSLCFTSNFSNFTPLGEKWKEYTAVLLLQYIPFFILLGYDLKYRLKKDK